MTLSGESNQTCCCPSGVTLTPYLVQSGLPASVNFVSASSTACARTRCARSGMNGAGHAATGRGVEATSSSSAPFIMARLIDALELQPGMRVLEIGTGTGYNAAVLARLLGAEHVISVEIDSVAANGARHALQRAGYPVRVVTGDGEDGYPPGAPYDRIIVTASVHTVPMTWVEQTRPGGMILVPWAPTFHPDWPLCRLTVRADGSAAGRCMGPAPLIPF